MARRFELVKINSPRISIRLRNRGNREGNRGESGTLLGESGTLLIVFGPGNGAVPRSVPPDARRANTPSNGFVRPDRRARRLPSGSRSLHPRDFRSRRRRWRAFPDRNLAAFGTLLNPCASRFRPRYSRPDHPEQAPERWPPPAPSCYPARRPWAQALPRCTRPPAPTTKEETASPFPPGIVSS
jgi:hypothetical protein